MTSETETFEFDLDQLTIGAFFTLPERADDRLYVGAFMILLIFGIIANIALVVTVLGSKDMRSNPSYYLLVMIAACDLACGFLIMFLQLGGIAFRQAMLGSRYSTLNNILHFFIQLFWWIFVFALTFTAFNRFVCIVFVGRYGALFTRRSTLVFMAAISLMGLAMGAPSMHPCCAVYWFFDEWTSAHFPSSTWFLQFDFVMTLITIGIMVVCYLGVGWQVRRKQAKGKGGRAELRIALQVGLMCGSYILNSIMWNFVPYMAASKWTNAGLNATTSVQYVIHPTIAFIFNGTIRKELLARMGISRSKSRVVSVTTSTTSTQSATRPLAAPTR